MGRDVLFSFLTSVNIVCVFTSEGGSRVSERAFQISISPSCNVNTLMLVFFSYESLTIVTVLNAQVSYVLG